MNSKAEAQASTGLTVKYLTTEKIKTCSERAGFNSGLVKKKQNAKENTTTFL